MLTGDGAALPSTHREALRQVAGALHAAGIDWRLGGSGLLAVLGIDVEVHDLDVTAAADDLDAVERACAPWIVARHLGPAPPPWCSDWLLRARTGVVEVDLIGGFCLLGPAGRTAVPQDLGGRLDLDGVVVPLADPAVWWWVYRTYRPAKAAALEAIVDAERRAAVAARLDRPS